MRKEIFTTGFYNLGIQGVGILSAIIIARVLGPEKAGSFNFGVSYSMLFQAIFVTGISSAFIGTAAQRRDDIEEIFSAYVVLMLGLNVLWCAVFLPYVYIMFCQDDWSMVLLIYTLVLSESLGLAYILNRDWYNVFVKQRVSSLPSFVRILLIKVFQVLVVVSASDLIFLGIASLLGSTFGLFYLFSGYQAETIIQRPKKITLYLLAIDSVKYSLINANRLVSQQLDKLFLGATVGYTVVGYYVVGQRLGSLVEIVGMSAGIVFFPLFTDLIVNGKKKEVRNAIEKYLLFVSRLILPALLLMSLCSEQLVSLVFGEKFREAGDVLKIFILLGVLSLLTIPYINILLGLGRQTRVIWLNLIAFFSMVLLFAGLSVFELEDLVQMEFVAVSRLLPYALILVGVVVSTQKFVRNSNTLLLYAVVEMLVYLAVEWLDQTGLSLWWRCGILLAGCHLVYLLFRWANLLTDSKS